MLTDRSMSSLMAADGHHTAGNNETLRADVHFFNGTMCSIETFLKYLGCGFHGHAYSAQLDCPNKRKTRVVVKVLTKRIKGPRGKWKYVSSTNTNEKRAVYQRLMANTSKNVAGYFGITEGTVSIPRAMLCDVMKQANNDRSVKIRYAGIVIDQKEPQTNFIGDVLAFQDGSGSHLHGWQWSSELRTLETRRQIVRDLVDAYRHLYERQVVHCDVALGHVHHYKNQTTLSDFEKIRVVDQENPELRFRFEQSQQLQLLSVIANVCAHVNGTFPFKVEKRICNGHNISTEILDNVTLAVQKCEFDQPMLWRDRITTKETREAYKELARWSGL